MKERELVLKYCLQNAVFYGGKANAGAVIGKILASESELRKDVQRLRKAVESAIKNVNSLTPEQQKERLEIIAPEMLEKEVKQQDELPMITGAEKGKVVTRFAPSPTGPLSLPHLLRAAMLSYLYAKKYSGRFILRFEDTDPKNIKPIFYKWIEEDLKMCGIVPDKVVRQSDNIQLYYKTAENLIKKGILYICDCPAERFRELKSKGRACKCRESHGIKEWKNMLAGKYGEGEASVRMKTSMNLPNPALRDPAMFRISKASHPLKKKAYHAWPLYNFASVIDDHKEGITHIFRGKEHEHNTKIQAMLYKALGWRQPAVINFGMVYLPGKKMHTRDIKEGIREGIFTGWDDPRLPTIRALMKRGFQAETFRRCSIGCSLSKTDICFRWETLYGVNRRLIDPKANRYMVVTNPTRLSLNKAPKISSVKGRLHPDFPGRGEKNIPVDTKKLYISGKDYHELQGKIFRLKSFGNIKLSERGNNAEYVGNSIDPKMQKIQWVSEPNIKVRIITPEFPEGREAIGETSMKKLKTDDLIQMERIGFARVDKTSKARDEIIVYFAHK